MRPERLTTPQEYVARQEALTEGALHEVIKESLADNSANMAVVGPFEKGDSRRLREVFPAEEVMLDDE